MNIYVDFDDCLCETARHFSTLAEEMFGLNIPYEKIKDNFIKGSTFSLELEDYYKMHFDYAVEDSPHAFKFFNHLPDLKVLVFDRPWNQDCDFPNQNYKRCSDWKTINDNVI